MRTSEKTTTIAAAVLAFQSDVRSVKKTATNPFHKSKYTPLPDLWEEIQPLLASHGLIYVTCGAPAAAYSEASICGLTCRLEHAETGEFYEGDFFCPLAKSDPQAYCGATTYLRRYGLCCLTGIAPDEDDDGNLASGLDTKAKGSYKNRPKPELKKSDGGMVHDTRRPSEAVLKIVEMFEGRILSTHSLEALRSVGREIVQALEENKIDQEQYDDLIHLCTHRKGEIG